MYKKHTQTSNKKLRRISSFGITPVKKKHIKLGHAGIVDHSVDLLIPDFLEVYFFLNEIKKEWTEATKN